MAGVKKTAVEEDDEAGAGNKAEKCDDENGKQYEWRGMGDMTEIALQSFAMKLGLGRIDLAERYKTMQEYPFDSSLKKMSIIVKDLAQDNTYLVFSKGAVEQLLTCCTTSMADQAQAEHPQNGHDWVATRTFDQSRDTKAVNERVDHMAKKGYRVISLAARIVTAQEVKDNEATKFQNLPREAADAGLTFLGLFGIQDPPRPDSIEAVRACHEAGITVHMLTGDHGRTAKAIAKQIGIIPEDYDSEEEDAERPNGRSIPLERTYSTTSNRSGFSWFRKKQATVTIPNPTTMDAKEFDSLTDQEIDAFVELPKVISRCSPDSKVKMVEAMKRRKKLVGMTGDGVNDAPSLKRADVGIAMGMDGSDVTKNASDLVLTTDDVRIIIINP